MAENTICTSKKAAEILKVTARTVQLWAESGILKSWKTPGGHRRYSTADVIALSEQIKNEDNIIQSPRAEKIVKLLIIEDDLDLLRLYQLTIEGWKMPVELELASDGYLGLIKLGEFKPDLMVLDLNLPHVDGFRIVESMQNSKFHNSTKLLVVSGLPVIDIKARLEDLEESSILTKPVPFNRIKQELTNLFNAK